MTETTQEQKRGWVIEALIILDFEQVGDMEIYTQEHGMMKTVVDLTAGVSVYFSDTNKQRVDTDDQYNTLANVRAILTDAEDGKMPTKVEPDEVISVSQPKSELMGTNNMSAVLDTPPVLTTTDIVRPAVSAQQAIAAWNEFQQLQKAILEPSDFQNIQGKDFKKKSAWRKFATFFNLNDKIVEEVQTPHQDSQGWTWKVKVVCTAPNHRTTEGVGMCSTSERNFAHVEHDTYVTAHTRAKNRAISDMVAAGEVSAEEIKT